MADSATVDRNHWQFAHVFQKQRNTVESRDSESANLSVSTNFMYNKKDRVLFYRLRLSPGVKTGLTEGRIKEVSPDGKKYKIEYSNGLFWQIEWLESAQIDQKLP